MKNIFVYIALSSILVGCAGSTEYKEPIAPLKKKNSIIINKSIDAVWKNTIPELGKNFYVINNLDKSSGLINISYAGDPEKYIDCGNAHSYVKNARGERNYDFPASRAHVKYETLDYKMGLLDWDRTMSLEGRMNLIFEELGANQTQVTANTKYIVTKTLNVRNMDNRTDHNTSTISFGSGQSASFPGSAPLVTCLPTGTFESEVLDLIK